MKLKFYLAALIIVAAVSCQQKDETTIEFYLTDIPEVLHISVARTEGNSGKVLYIDSSETTIRKFTVKCDTVAENICYTVGLHLPIKGEGITMMERKLFIKSGTTTKVSGADVYASYWTIESQNPEQAFQNTLNDSTRDILKQMYQIVYKMQSSSDRNKHGAMTTQSRLLSNQLTAKKLEVMKTMPIDQYWIAELKNQSYTIRDREEGHPICAIIEELYNMLPDSTKQSKDGRVIHAALHTKSPEIGDHIIDYDLYDAQGGIHHLADYKGKWLLLDFSSYYCGACRIFTPTTKYLSERGNNNNFEIITIIGNTQSQFEEMTATEKYISPLLHDRDENDGIFTIYKVSAYPTFFVVDPDGIITDRFMGADVATIANLIQSHNGFASPKIQNENDVKVIDNPSFSTIEGDLLIDRIEIYKDSVVISCTDPIYGGYKITKGTGLFSNGKCISKIINSTVGYDINTKVPSGEIGKCRLTFAPLPKGIKQFDLITGDSENCCHVYGVKVENQ